MQQFLFEHKSKLLRLDSCLKFYLPNYSRNYLTTLIDGGLVLVNDALVTKSSFKVKFSDKMLVNIPPTPEIQANNIAFSVIDEQRDFLIIEKPANVLTHPAATSPNTPSIAQAILDKINFPTGFIGLNRAGIVHRLDKDTSGLLIIAKNPEAQNQFAKIFQDRKLIKKYYAVSQGLPSQTHLTIDKPIGRDPRSGTKMKIYGITPKEAISVVDLVDTFLDQEQKDISLLRVQIMTGRTHQIRVHLASLGLPIVGDAVYGSTSKYIARQALHAYFLEFIYDGKTFQYESPLPQDIKKIMFIKKV